MLHHTVSLPAYVSRLAPKFISDQAFKIMVNGQQLNTKQDWADLALWLGYDTIGPMRVILNNLRDQGFVLIDKYAVDWTPLFDACFNEALGYLPKITEPEKEKRQGEYALYDRLIKAAPNFLRDNKHQWATVYLPDLLKEFNADIIVEYVTVSEKVYSKMMLNQPHEKAIWPRGLAVKIRTWLQQGKPTELINRKIVKI